MAQTEVAYQLKDSADIMIASEDVQYTPGWPLKNVLTSIIDGNKTAEMKPEDVAKAVVDECGKVANKYTETTSAIDLKKTNEIARATREFSKALLDVKDPKSIERIREDFQQVKYYPNIAYHPPYLKDFYELVESVKEDSNLNAPKVKKEAENVMRAIEESIIAEQHLPYNTKNKYREVVKQKAHGMTINMPTIKDKTKDGYEELPFARDTQWNLVIDKYKSDEIKEYTSIFGLSNFYSDISQNPHRCWSLSFFKWIYNHYKNDNSSTYLRH